MSLAWQDGDFTVAAAQTPLRPASATPDGKYNILSQDFMQFVANFAALPIGTAHPTVADYFLVEETPPQIVGGGVCRWTRVYAKVPDQHNEYQSFAYNYIGFVGSQGYGFTVVSGRQREIKNVKSRIQYDYFLAGSPTYPTPEAIPLIIEQKYYVVIPSLTVDWIFDGAPSSTPSRTDYDALVAANAELVAEPSMLDRWRGNIYVRKTRYVPAL
jgi:hypothetical protein